MKHTLLFSRDAVVTVETEATLAVEEPNYRALALAAGAQTYHGRPCGQGHGRRRYVSSRACVSCIRNFNQRATDSARLENSRPRSPGRVYDAPLRAALLAYYKTLDPGQYKAQEVRAHLRISGSRWDQLMQARTVPVVVTRVGRTQVAFIVKPPGGQA